MISRHHLLIGVVVLGLSLSGATARPEGSGGFSIVYPGKPWSLVLTLQGFRMQRRPADPGSPSILASGSQRASGMRVSILMEPAARKGGAVACRKHYWKLARRSPIDKTGVTLSERDDMAMVEYMAEEYGGVALRQKNVNAYLERDGVWIAIHLWKSDYRPDDQARFERVLGSVRFQERRAR
jgi:hypothetical protein